MEKSLKELVNKILGTERLPSAYITNLSKSIEKIYLCSGLTENDFKGDSKVIILKIFKGVLYSFIINYLNGNKLTGIPLLGNVKLNISLIEKDNNVIPRVDCSLSLIEKVKKDVLKIFNEEEDLSIFRDLNKTIEKSFSSILDSEGI